jgi:hypothetical protein
MTAMRTSSAQSPTETSNMPSPTGDPKPYQFMDFWP